MTSEWHLDTLAIHTLDTLICMYRYHPTSSSADTLYLLNSLIFLARRLFRLFHVISLHTPHVYSSVVQISEKDLQYICLRITDIR